MAIVPPPGAISFDGPPPSRRWPVGMSGTLGTPLPLLAYRLRPSSRDSTVTHFTSNIFIRSENDE
jgi:hypothetical protein